MGLLTKWESSRLSDGSGCECFSRSAAHNPSLDHVTLKRLEALGATGRRLAKGEEEEGGGHGHVYEMGTTCGNQVT